MVLQETGKTEAVFGDSSYAVGEDHTTPNTHTVTAWWSSCRAFKSLHELQLPAVSGCMLLQRQEEGARTSK